MTTDDGNPTAKITRERENLLAQLQEWLEVPMLLLSIAWLALLIIEMVWSLNDLMQSAMYFIWAVFILDFALKLFIAPQKLLFMKSNWLTAISLAVPAFRIFRIMNILRLTRVVKAAGFVRGVRVLKVLTSVNRGMRALSSAMQRRGFGYIMLVTVMVTFAGAAGMYNFENKSEVTQGFENYGTALWWTAMIITTMGSQYWPETPEGRVLCFFLALYSFTVFGYVTATLASYFIGRDAEDEEAEVASAKSIAALQEEITALRAELRSGRTSPEEK